MTISVFPLNHVEQTFSGVLFADVSDHLPDFSISNLHFEKVNHKNKHLKREINAVNIRKFIDDIKKKKHVGMSLMVMLTRSMISF